MKWYGKKWIQKNLQEIVLSCRFLHIYTKIRNRLRSKQNHCQQVYRSHFFSFNPEFFAKIIKKPTFFSNFVFLCPIFIVCNRFFSRANIYLLLMEHKDTKTRMELGYDKQQKTHQCVIESFKP